MAEEFHNSFLHVVIDCNTGNGNLDKSIEKNILSYVYLTVYCIENGRMKELLEKASILTNEFKKMEEEKNRKIASVLKVLKGGICATKD